MRWGWLVLLGLAGPAAAQEDWCRPDTVESQIRRWGTAPFAKKKELTRATDTLRTRLARELLGTLTAQLDPRYEAEVLALTGRVQTLSVTQRKVSGGREVCVVVQMPKGGLLGDLPSDVGRALLSKWHDPIAAFAAGRPLWVREVALRDGPGPEVDEVVVPRVEDLVRRNLIDLPRWEPDGGARPADVLTLDVRVTPYPAYYAVEGVVRDASGRSMSVGAELAKAWLGEIGTRQPLSSRDVRIDKFDGPGTVFRGKPATLSWSAPNARGCKIGPTVGDVPTSGKVEVLPGGDTTWTLTCTDGLKTVTRDVSVGVRLPPTQVFVTAEPLSVTPGGSATIAWQGTGLVGCVMDPGGEVGVMGQMTVRPAQPTTWTVRCRGEDGQTAVGAVTVGVGEAPVVVPAAVAAGAGPARLLVRSLDGQWVDVRVDGAVVAQLYNNPEATVEIANGPHVVEVVPFMAGDAAGGVRIAEIVNGVATLGVKSDGSIVCYDVPVCVKQ